MSRNEYKEAVRRMVVRGNVTGKKSAYLIPSAMTLAIFTLENDFPDEELDNIEKELIEELKNTD
jgi:hypothetical protein